MVRKTYHESINSEKELARIAQADNTVNRLDKSNTEHSREPDKGADPARRVVEHAQDGRCQDERVKELLACLDGEPETLVSKAFGEPESLAEERLRPTSLLLDPAYVAGRSVGVTDSEMRVTGLVPEGQDAVRQVTIITERSLLAEERLTNPRAKNRDKVGSLVKTKLNSRLE